jgi:hypothetical protein
MLKKFRWIGFVTLLLAISFTAAAQFDNDTVTLRTFINPVFAIQGMRPLNWSETARYSGVYVRANDSADRTVLIIQAGDTTLAAVLRSVVRQYELNAAPARIARIQTDTLSWSIYKIERALGSQTLYVDVAVAADNDRLFIVMMQTNQLAYEQLHEQVFLTTIDALAPMVNVPADAETDVREPQLSPTPTTEVTPEVTAEATSAASE